MGYEENTFEFISLNGISAVTGILQDLNDEITSHLPKTAFVGVVLVRMISRQAITYPVNSADLSSFHGTLGG